MDQCDVRPFEMWLILCCLAAPGSTERELQCDSLGCEQSLILLNEPSLLRRLRGHFLERGALMCRHSRGLVLATTCAAVAIAYSFSPLQAVQAQDNRIKAQSDAIGENPAQALTTPTVPSKNTAAREERKDREAEAELKRRAGEQVDDDPQGRAQMLGMSLQEADNGRVKVVEVGPTSPAFQSGVRAGDEVISYQGFAADSYRKMIDGMRRLTTEAPDGTMMSLVVLRDGKRVALRIRNPVTPQRTIGPRPLAQATPSGQVATQETLIAPGGVPVAGGGNIAIGNAGPFVDFFGAAPANPNERAVAEIFRLNAPPVTNPPVIADSGIAPANGGGRIGLAGFRDTPSGMVVMVDVGALVPGTYTVGISDPSVLGGTTPDAATPNPNVEKSRVADPPLLPLPPPDAAPVQPAPSGTNQPQGKAAPALRGTVPETVLAQVADSVDSGTTNSAAGQGLPAGQPNVNDAQPNQTSQTAPGVDQTTATTTTTSVPGATRGDIGTITIDQSGTGRMQTTVEGIQVRNVVGQAIVIYSQDGSQQTVPVNLGVGTAAEQGASDPALARGSRRRIVDSRPAATDPPAAVPTQPTARVPVAAGIIRLMSDRRPPPSDTEAAATPTGAGGVVEQPASAAPAAGRNPVR
jgi:hypothetical protein